MVMRNLIMRLFVTIYKVNKRDYVSRGFNIERIIYIIHMIQFYSVNGYLFCARTVLHKDEISMKKD